MERTALHISIVFLIFPSICLGSFSFDSKESVIVWFCNASCGSSCSDSHTCLKLLWDYNTDETVTVIEWYKQPGVLIARIFGVNSGAPFTKIAPYDALPYTVTQYENSTYKAAIEITGVSNADAGAYSVNVTAASPQSDVYIVEPVSPLTQNDKPTVDCSSMTCTLPAGAVGVTTEWTKSGDTHRCTLRGGNAECCDCCDKIYAECTKSCSCLWALFLMLMPPIVQLVVLLIIMCKQDIGDFKAAMLWLYHMVLTIPFFGWFTVIVFIPCCDEIKKVCLFKKECCKGSLPEIVINILINILTTLGCSLVLGLEKKLCENGEWELCFLASGLCYPIATGIIVYRHICGCYDCGCVDRCKGTGGENEERSPTCIYQVMKWTMDPLPKPSAEVTILHPSGNELFKVKGRKIITNDTNYGKTVGNTGNTNADKGHVEFTLKDVTETDSGDYSAKYVPIKKDTAISKVGVTLVLCEAAGEDKVIKWTMDPVPPSSVKVTVLHPSGQELFTVQNSTVTPAKTEHGMMVCKAKNETTDTGCTIEFTLKNVTVEDAGDYSAGYVSGRSTITKVGVILMICEDNQVMKWTMDPLPEPSDEVTILHPSGNELFKVKGRQIITNNTYYGMRVSNTGNTNADEGQVEFTLKDVTKTDLGDYSAKYVPINKDTAITKVGVKLVLCGDKVKVRKPPPSQEVKHRKPSLTKSKVSHSSLNLDNQPDLFPTNVGGQRPRHNAVPPLENASVKPPTLKHEVMNEKRTPEGNNKKKRKKKGGKKQKSQDTETNDLKKTLPPLKDPRKSPRPLPPRPPSESIVTTRPFP